MDGYNLMGFTWTTSMRTASSAGASDDRAAAKQSSQCGSRRASLMSLLTREWATT